MPQDKCAAGNVTAGGPFKSDRLYLDPIPLFFKDFNPAVGGEAFQDPGCLL